MHATAPPPALIALYHAVGTPAATGYRDALEREALARQLDWLAARYRIVPLEEMAARLAAGGSLEGLAALTFDDNHRSVLEEALPLCAARDLPATWFLIGGPLAGRPFWRRLVTELERRGEVAAFLAFALARAPQVASLRPERFYRDSKDPARIDTPTLAALLEAWFEGAGPPPDFISPAALRTGLPPGVRLGNHTFGHPVLAGLPAEVQAEEMRRGRGALEALGLPLSDALALPFGGVGTWDRATLRAAADAGVALLLSTAPGLAPAQPAGPPQGSRLGPPLLQRALLGRALQATG